MSKTKAAEGSKLNDKKREKTPAEKARSTRETVESIIIAVILAFMFRAFEAEAFVIPTGSMAPTLQGRHFDVKCKKCDHRYRTGASDETSLLVGATCPICRYTQTLDPPVVGHWGEPDECAMSGDRILVNKFAYQLGEPKRWDVIVFKYPGNAKQNYIKRLVGLPGERVRIEQGNIYVRKEGEEGFEIARKSPEKVVAMLQLVDDTGHLPPELVAAGWPSRWQAWSRDGRPAAWRISPDGREFSPPTEAGVDSWLRYRHLIPSFDDWEQLANGRPPASLADRNGELITDFYAYNCNRNAVPYSFYSRVVAENPRPFEGEIAGPAPASLGLHWVGELALECIATVAGDAGELLLDLVEGGVHYGCRINLADGVATLSIDGRFEGFHGAAPATRHPTASTKVKGPGTYRLRFANVDDQLFLWVNDWPVAFDLPTTFGPSRYKAPAIVKPAWSPADPGDLAPVGVGSNGASVAFSRLRVLRDVYYIADSPQRSSNDDYGNVAVDELRAAFEDPSRWKDANNVFDRRRYVEFPFDPAQPAYFGPDQFFTCGDNSPASKDARLWSKPDFQDPWNDAPPPYVDRSLLIGKALLIYWPHTWNRPVPYITPNFERMRLIR